MTDDLLPLAEARSGASVSTPPPPAPASCRERQDALHAALATHLTHSLTHMRDKDVARRVRRHMKLLDLTFTLLHAEATESVAHPSLDCLRAYRAALQAQSLFLKSFQELETRQKKNLQNKLIRQRKTRYEKMDT